MLLANRSGFLVKPKITAKNYVQDGLIHAWDAIENAGFGKFSANITTWADLVGNNHLNCKNVGFNGNWAIFNGDGMAVYTKYAYQINPDNRTLECVYVAENKFTKQYVATTVAMCIQGYGNYLLIVPGRGWTTYPKYLSPNPENGISVTITYNLKSVTGGWCNGSPLTKSGSDYDIDPTNWGISIGASAGNNNTSSFGTMVKPFIGRVGCVRIYEKQLSESEIEANYAVDKVRFNLP